MFVSVCLRLRCSEFVCMSLSLHVAAARDRNRAGAERGADAILLGVQLPLLVLEFVLVLLLTPSSLISLVCIVPRYFSGRQMEDEEVNAGRSL